MRLKIEFADNGIMITDPEDNKNVCSYRLRNKIWNGMKEEKEVCKFLGKYLAQELDERINSSCEKAIIEIKVKC